MRHWHWLGRVTAIAGLTPAELDRRRGDHLLTRTLPADRRFNNILIDGYDPGATISLHDSLSLLNHVNQFEEYRDAWRDYHHPFWRHLESFYPDHFDQEAWLEQAGPRLGLVAVTYEDLSHADALGLAIHAPEHPWSDALDTPAVGERLVSLDGLLLLLLLLRDLQARDADDDQRPWLRSQLNQSARAFSAAWNYQHEFLHTWECLIETRMLRWTPDDRPSDEQLALAEQDIRAANATRPETGLRGTRRLERRTYALALSRRCAVRTSADPKPGVANWNTHWLIPRTERTGAIANWLKKERRALSTLLELAIDRLMEDTSPSPLPAVSMPRQVAEGRRRPWPSEETFEHFGDRLPFDLVAIDIVDD